MATDNESLADKLKAKEVFDEFTELMFSLETDYAELLVSEARQHFSGRIVVGEDLMQIEVA